MWTSVRRRKKVGAAALAREPTSATSTSPTKLIFLKFHNKKNPVESISCSPPQCVLAFSSAPGLRVLPGALDPYRRRHPGFRGHKMTRGHTRLEIWMHHVEPAGCWRRLLGSIRSQSDCGAPRVAIARRCASRSFHEHVTLSHNDTQTETSPGYIKAFAHSRLIRLSPRDEGLRKLAALPLLPADYAVLKLQSRARPHDGRDATEWRGPAE